MPPVSAEALSVSGWVWLVTVVAVAVVFAVDLLFVGRGGRQVSWATSLSWVAGSVALATGFGIGLGVTVGSGPAGEFAAGYLTEYSLSIDNLFVFMVLMARFAVPNALSQRVLLVGIVLALMLRGVFIAIGATIIGRFPWVFLLFGVFLIITAWRLVKDGLEQPSVDAKQADSRVVRTLRRWVPTSGQFEGKKLTVRVDGRRVATSLLVVMVALGVTDLLFALDSIPAIFGLTRSSYLVFTANAFALLGLRHLFFIIGRLLDRLVHLAVGLSLILGFIGVKLIMEAFHDYGITSIGPVRLPEIGIGASLVVITLILATVTATSLWASTTTTTRNGS
jgi:tellurite resistance protein TerC